MQQIKIFLASPSDTNNERQAVQKAIDEINKTRGKDVFYIDLFMWEESTYSSIGDDGQNVINQQNSRYDIFVGVMWKKFGKPTPRANSATEEEYNIALDRFRKGTTRDIKFYFKTSDITLNDDLEQAQKVKDFKAKVHKDGVYTRDIDFKKGFEEQFRCELNLYLTEYLKLQTDTQNNNNNNIIKDSTIELTINENFDAYLNDMEATFAHSNVDKIYLEDIYLPPDLQKIENHKKTNINKTIKLSSVIDGIDIDGVKYVFLGNELAGKTACSKYLFRNYYNQNLIPILIKGDEITDKINIENIIKSIERKIIEQYQVPFLLTEINIEDVLIIIDDFHKSAKGLNKYWYTLIRNLETKFKNIILTGSPLMTIDKDYKEPFKNFEMFTILEFGPVLRKELVHKWKTLKIDERDIDKNELYRKEDEALQHIKTAIGKNYFPVYPFYILSMLQALEGNSVLNPNYSIHGFYYENLINRCFSKFIANKKDINLYYNYLTNFCYYLFDKQAKELSIKEFKEFHSLYCQKVDINYSIDKILETFDRASLLHINHKVHVKEKYVFYFFVAKYLADNINNQPTVKDIISKMSIRIFRDDYANIILFITHLSKDKFIIDELIKNANLIFKNVEPAKLEDEIKEINKLVETIPKQVLEQVDVETNRQQELLEEEEAERVEREYENEKGSYNNFGLEDDISSIDFLAWLTMAFKTIDILGQIAKKHWGDMDGDLKLKLVNSTYNLGLRFLGYYLQLLQTNSEEIVDHLTKVFSSKSFKDRYALKKSIEEETRDYVFRLCF